MQSEVRLHRNQLPLDNDLIISTTKTLVSASLTTQDVAGIVSYINNLVPVLPVQINEIVKFHVTDTDQVFELLIRNRSFGLSTPAIVDTDILELRKNQDLQSVLDTGNVSTEPIIIDDGNSSVTYTSTSLVRSGPTNSTTIIWDQPTSDETLIFPNKSGTIATIGDLVGGLPTGEIPSSFSSTTASTGLTQSAGWVTIPGITGTVTIASSVPIFITSTYVLDRTAGGATTIVGVRIIKSDLSFISQSIQTNIVSSNQPIAGSIKTRTGSLSPGVHTFLIQAMGISGGDSARFITGQFFVQAQQAPKGEDGQGVPLGGTTYSVLIKNSSGDYDTTWGAITDDPVLVSQLSNKADLIGGIIPSYQLPSYVDDVLEYANFGSLPVVGETGKIYITLDNNKTYRWSGSIYTEISPSEVTSVNGKVGVVTLVPSDIGAQPLLTNPVTGTGSVNYLSKFSGTSTLSQSLLFDNGTNIGIGTITPSATFHVVGNTLISGTMTATTIVKSGGLSTQFLKADGSVDSNTYLTTGSASSTYLTSASASSTYLPLSGGVITGNLGVTGTFSASIPALGATATTFLTHTNGLIQSRTNAQVLSDIGAQAALTNPTTGTGSTNFITKWSGSTTQTDSQIFDNGTNIGVGTSTPSFKLDIRTTDNTSGVVQQLRGGSSLGATIRYSRDGNYTWDAGIGASGTNNIPTSFFGIAESGTTPRFVVAHTSGNVGIGTITPSERLHVIGNAVVSGTITGTFSRAGGTSTQFLKADGSVDTNTYLTTGTAASTYLPLAGGTLTGNLNVPSFASVVINGSLTNFRQGNNTTLLAQTPMTGIWHDLFAFTKVYTTTFEVSGDDVVWVPGTLDRRLFAQKEDQSITVLNYTTTKAVRWNFTNVSWGLAQWLVIGFTWQSVAASKTVIVETSTDNSNWTTRHTSTYSNIADTIYHYVESYGGDAFMRVKIVWNSGLGNIALSSIKLLSARSGDQGRGKEYEYPYTWDENQRVTFANTAIGDGNVSAPSLAFTSQSTTGLYKPSGVSALAVTVAGSEMGRFTTTGLTSPTVTISNLAALGATATTFLTHTNGLVQSRTSAQVLTDIGAQAALTNPVTGTGSVNFISKWNGATTQTNSQLFDNGTNVGIGTSVPTHTLTLPSTATGWTHYNTVDQTTNFERFRGYWTGNTYNLRVESGGTGIPRNMSIGTGRLINIAQDGPVFYDFNAGTGMANITHIGVNSPISPSSGTSKMLTINPTINQSGTAGFTGLEINPTITATGSGVHKLIDVKWGGAERFNILSSGNVGIGTSTPLQTLDIVGRVRIVSGANFGDIMTPDNTRLGFRIDDSGNRLYGSTSFRNTSGGELMFLSNVGSLGIGTITPSEKLHVVGNSLISGTMTATTIVKSGGLSSEFLKADGSVDTNTYLTTGSASNVYLPLSGGTLTGPLTTTDITINGTLLVNGTTSTVNSTTVTVKDPIITLGGNTPPVSNDMKDRGVEFRYFDTVARVGFFGMDDTDGRFKYFTNATNTSEVFSGTLGTAEFGSVIATTFSATSLTVSNITALGSTASVFLTHTGGLVQSRTSAQVLSDIGAQAALTNPNTGTGSVNFISKWNGTTTQTSSQLFDDGTNVGLNTSSPITRLTVNGHISLTSGNSLRFYNAGQTAWGEIAFNEASNRLQVQRGIQSSDSTFRLGMSSENSFINAVGGNVGIGTASPTEKLHVVGNTIVTGTFSASIPALGTTATTFVTHTNGLLQSRTNAQVLSDIGAQAALTNPNTGTGSTNYISKWSGTTTQVNSQVFDNATNVGIGTITPTEKLEVAGNIRATSFRSGSASVAYNSSSKTLDFIFI